MSFIPGEKKLFGMPLDFWRHFPKNADVIVVTFKVRGDFSGQPSAYAAYCGERHQILSKAVEDVRTLLEEPSTYNVQAKEVTPGERRHLLRKLS